MNKHNGTGCTDPIFSSECSGNISVKEDILLGSNNETPTHKNREVLGTLCSANCLQSASATRDLQCLSLKVPIDCACDNVPIMPLSGGIVEHSTGVDLCLGDNNSAETIQRDCAAVNPCKLVLPQINLAQENLLKPNTHSPSQSRKRHDQYQRHGFNSVQSCLYVHGNGLADLRFWPPQESGDKSSDQAGEKDAL